MAREEPLLMSSLVLVSTDSRYLFAKEKEFHSEDAINVSADAEDATGNSKPKKHT